MEKKKKKWLSLFLAVILAFTGLPVSLMAAGNAKSQTQETTKILPSQTSGEINCFSYESFSGKSWTYLSFLYLSSLPVPIMAAYFYCSDFWINFHFLQYTLPHLL